jgi:hypothetical protein
MAKNKKWASTTFLIGNNYKSVDVFTNRTTASGRDNDKIIFDLVSIYPTLVSTDYYKIVKILKQIMPLEVSMYNRNGYKLEVYLARGKKYDDISDYPKMNVGRSIISVVIANVEEIINGIVNQNGQLPPPPLTPTSSTPEEIIESSPIIQEEEQPKSLIKDNNQLKLQELKTDMSQLLFLKSIVSPIDFEQNITISQLIAEKQKQINQLNFYILENNLKSFDIFEDLFEQSFSEINHTYDNIYSQPDNPVDFFTPNGKRSALSLELNEIIRTPQFKEWFGEWELNYIYKGTDAVEIDCSKVLTENYEPRVVWHGTGKEFSYFRFDNFPAAYFAVKREYSQWFADAQAGEDGYTIPFFLNIKNPLDLTMFSTKEVSSKDFFDYLYLKTGMDMEQLGVNPIFLEPDFPNQKIWIFIRNNAKMLKVIADSNVYDGIHFYETNPNVPEGEVAHETEAYITFFENQAKIAAPNRGLILLASLKSFLLKSGGKI